jgi:hypothetical protein
LGDPQQLQAIEAGAAFRAIIEKTGYLELTEIRRQIELWQQEATKEFALRQVAEAIELYEKNGCVHCFATQVDAKDALVSKWNKERTEHPEKSQIMLSYTRRDVGELNERARDCRKDELGEDHKLEVSGGVKDFAVGDRVYFLQNNRDMGVKNGTLGTIKNIEGLSIAVIADGNKNEQKRVTFGLDRYNHITHGYAATIHKAQGVTVDQSYILASKHMDSHAAYVGMSRHREKAELFWSKDEFTNKQELEQVLGRDRSKDITVDYLGRDPGEIENLEARNFVDFVKDDKTVAELVNEITAVGKERSGQETSVQRYLRELREITQSAKNDVDRIQYNREIKEYLKEDRSRLVVNVEISQKNLGDTAVVKKHTPSIEEREAENLVGRYYELEDKYNKIKREGRSRYDEVMAQGDVRRCAQAICKDNYAMDYLQKNDTDLFKQMNERREQEKVLELQKGFELSL